MSTAAQQDLEALRDRLAELEQRVAQQNTPSAPPPPVTPYWLLPAPPSTTVMLATLRFASGLPSELQQLVTAVALGRGKPCLQVVWCLQIMSALRRSCTRGALKVCHVLA